MQLPHPNTKKKTATKIKLWIQTFPFPPECENDSFKWFELACDLLGFSARSGLSASEW